jgi:hypothetical protein
VPRTAIGIGVPFGCLRQGDMNGAAFRRRRRSVDGGARQRVTERHPLADRQQPVRLRLVRSRRPDGEPLGRAPQQQRIADRLRRRNQHQAPRFIGQRLDSSDEALLDPACQRLRAQ